MGLSRVSRVGLTSIYRLTDDGKTTVATDRWIPEAIGSWHLHPSRSHRERCREPWKHISPRGLVRGRVAGGDRRISSWFDMLDQSWLFSCSMTRNELKTRRRELGPIEQATSGFTRL